MIGEDEERLEEDGEVIPEAEQAVAQACFSHDIAEDLRHAKRQRRRAASPSKESVLTDAMGQLSHGGGSQREAPASNRVDGCLRRNAHRSRRRVDREEYSRLQTGSRHDCHDPDKSFEQHGSITDRPGVPLAGNHLGSRARRNQRMETGDCTASDGDEAERENLAGEDRAGSVDEARKRR